MALGMIAGHAAAQQGTAWTGVFTAIQAERGSTAYGQSCAGCHGVDLVATDPEAPGLAGFSFNIQWVGHTLAERFDRISTTMPIGAAGSLSEQVYLDIIAYILSFNGYPVGDTEMTPETDLAEIAITRVP
ncbi:MAG: c-type cytochrome [Bauldia sp.]|nr:c-type cytochrome [Bauldia sp.]MCW5717554.1 c-type cytochrome [Bauldia sp.]